jgi:hypothetical protein
MGISRFLIIAVLVHELNPIASDALLKSRTMTSTKINRFELMRIYGGMLDVMNPNFDVNMTESIDNIHRNRINRNISVWDNRTSHTANQPLGMADEVARALSFQLPFPFARLHPLNPAKLAAAGFYHYPTRALPDRAACFSCGLALHSWCTSSFAPSCSALQRLF